MATRRLSPPGELGGKMVEAMLQPDSPEQFDGAILPFRIEARFVSKHGICTFSTRCEWGRR